MCPLCPMAVKRVKLDYTGESSCDINFTSSHCKDEKEQFDWNDVFASKRCTSDQGPL